MSPRLAAAVLVVIGSAVGVAINAAVGDDSVPTRVVAGDAPPTTTTIELDTMTTSASTTAFSTTALSTTVTEPWQSMDFPTFPYPSTTTKRSTTTTSGPPATTTTVFAGPFDLTGSFSAFGSTRPTVGGTAGANRVGGGTWSITITATGLLPGVGYWIYVQASTANGLGQIRPLCEFTSSADGYGSCNGPYTEQGAYDGYGNGPPGQVSIDEPASVGGGYNVGMATLA